MKKNVKHVAICGVPGSDNIGDLVIADCMKYFFETHLNKKVTLCDVSYRDGVATNSVKSGQFERFQKLPSLIRQIMVLVFFTLKYFKFGRSFYNDKLADVDHVIIGGGQLISDVDCNFPFKLWLLMRQCKKRNLSVTIAAVGVGSKWSKLGKWLMTKVLTSVQVDSIYVRDELSVDTLKKFFDLQNVKILPDPALMSSFIFECDKSSIPTIALGVADIIGLNYTSDKQNSEKSNTLEDFSKIIDSVKAVLPSSSIVLFTNGAIEDEIFMHEELIPYLTKSNDHDFVVAPKCQSSMELCETIGKSQAVIAFRLHASIIAASYSIQSVAIGWDNKVTSFYRSQNRENDVYDSLNALNSGVDWKTILATTVTNKLSGDHTLNLYKEAFASTR